LTNKGNKINCRQALKRVKEHNNADIAAKHNKNYKYYNSEIG
jgi:hypothetical protein